MSMPSSRALVLATPRISRAASRRSIEAAIPGARVEVDLDRKRVTVDAQHQADSVRQAVEDAGFEFAGPAS